ncbi:MAG: hypothetical protein Q8P13_04980 [bacterium]|nr:hypothetical protein [bacterium]
MVENPNSTNQPNTPNNKVSSLSKRKLVWVVSIIALIILAVVLYLTFVSDNQKTTDTNKADNKTATKSVGKNSTAANTKEDTKTVEEGATTQKEGELIITEKDFGQFFAISNGQQVFLRLSNKYSWSETEPKTTGEITLVPTNYKTDPGFKEWQVNYTTSSTATIESNITTGTLGTDAEITKFFVTLKIQKI